MRRRGWTVQEIDIIRGRHFDLTNSKYTDKILHRINSNFYAAVLASPPCNTYTRVRFANRQGPRPLRSLEHRQGFPWLRAHEKQQAKIGTVLENFTWQAVSAQLRNAPGCVALEFPEDLGAVKSGEWRGTRPASIWQHEDFGTNLKAGKMVSGALYQSSFEAPYLKPTRFGFKAGAQDTWAAESGTDTPFFYWGAPQFNDQGFYEGPLPKADASQLGLLTLAKKAGESGFRTTNTAARPAPLCETIAAIVDEQYKLESIRPGDEYGDWYCQLGTRL